MAIRDSPPPASRHGVRFRAVLRGLVGIGALVLAGVLIHRLVAEVGWDEVHGRLVQAHGVGVVAAAVLLTAQMVAWSWRLRLAASRIAREPGFPVTFLALVGTATLNLLVPFARLVASLLRARYLALASKPRAGKGVFFGVVLYEQLAHLTVMSSLTYCGLIGAAVLLGQRTAFTVLAAAGVVFVLAAAWLWLRHRSALRSWLERLFEERADQARSLTGHAVEGSKTAARVLLRLVSDRTLYLPNLLLGAAVFGAGMAAQWVVFRALGVEVHPLAVAVTVSLGQAAGVLFATPGGLGATEAAMIATFGLFGVGRAEAASAVLLFRGLHYAVVLGLGLPSLAALEWRFSREGRRSR